MLVNNILETVGGTPLLKANRWAASQNVDAEVLAKLECFNPCSSVKDRVALAMIDDAESRGIIDKSTNIIEPTSGNTGIGLAMVCAARGYKLTLTMPETMSVERRKILKALGANIVLTDGSLGMSGAIAEADRLAKTCSGFIPAQFENPANPLAHQNTTAREILSDTQNKLDIFVACVGTGGTVSGIGRALKDRLPAVKIYAVEPLSSHVLTGGQPGPHKIQGIGAGFVPKNFDKNVVDEILQVADTDAFEESRSFAKKEGILVGISSGAALCAVKQIARSAQYKGERIVVLLPDSGERYLSTALYD